MLEHSLTPLSTYLGVEVQGLDLARLDEDDTTSRLQALLDEHLLLLFRRQQIEPGEIVALARRLGPVVDLKRANNPGAVHVPGCPEIKVISNARAADGRPIGDGDAAELGWHSDGSHLAVPPALTIFACRVAPAAPPRTSFLDMRRVYDTLPDGLKARIVGLTAVHALAKRENRLVDRLKAVSLTEAERRDGPTHPLVRRHPRSGRGALYLPRQRDALVHGLPPEDSKRLLDELWDQAWDAPFRCALALEAGDVVVWDQRVTMHRREAFDADQDRVMWHLTVEGETPLALAA